jgi:hypothetical protein
MLWKFKLFLSSLAIRMGPITSGFFQQNSFAADRRFT